MARYSRPAFEQNEMLHEDIEELANPVPSVSLKFAMPPIAQVRSQIASGIGACSASSARSSRKAIFVANCHRF